MTTPGELIARYTAGERFFAEVHLAHADLRDARLKEANLRSANFTNAVLTGADLRGADLEGAMLEGANLEGARLTGANLEGAKIVDAKLADADLSCGRLCGAILDGVDLSGADLTGADLTGASLVRVNLGGADLSSADLSYANLYLADLTAASLKESTLDGTTIDQASLVTTRLTSAKLEYCYLGTSVLCNVDLSPFCRAKINHTGESFVDFRSIVQSVREPRLKDFLRGTGMPDVFVEYMVDCAKSLSPELVFSMLQSTFISYGGPDEAFAWKLNDALQKRGVTTFFFKEHATPGDKLHRVMRKGVNEHDRTILICSESSLQRAGLLNELEETLAREARDGGRPYLIPVRLDDYVINGWKPKDPDVAQAVRDRVIADFRDHEDPARFDAELAKLINALKKPGP